MSADTSGAGHGGTIDVVATEHLSLKDASSISSNSNSLLENAGNAGVIRLNAPVIDVQSALVSASTVGPGNAGDIVLEANRLSLGTSETGRLSAGGATIFTRTTGPGLGGDITIRGRNGPESQAEIVTISGLSRMLSESTASGNSDVQGNAGNISIQTSKLTLSENSRLSTASESSTGNAGNITIVASDDIRISSHGELSSEAREFASGNGGRIAVSAPTVLVESGGLISTNTDYLGNAGEIQIKANSFQLKTGGHISSSVINQNVPDFIPNGSAGIITVQGLTSPAQSVLIDGSGSGLFTDTQGTGAGGNIALNANSVTLTNGAAVSASSTGQIENPGAAGSINITATNGFTMKNSTITTLAGQGASGGDIKVTTSPEATVWLQNSKISASVADGPGGGGNIEIDPQFVILQNSQILAQAAQGQGGAITIIANLFLPDANSIVNADSGNPALNGTVTIQSPNAPGSGQIQPLGKSPLLPTSLLNQRCAALAGGEFSSFTVAGRDSLPTEPDSWLASPLATLSTGMTPGTSLAGETALLSLRQIAPAGFLTQAFAMDWSAGCQS